MAEEDYYVNRLSSLQGDSRRNWNVLNTLLGMKNSSLSDHFVVNNVKTYDHDVIANEFCNYFVNHSKNIQSSISPSVNNYSELIPLGNNLFNFEQCSPQEIFNVIKNMKKEGSNSDMSVKFMKMCGLPLADIRCNLFDICYRESTYPNMFKCSRITPLFKKGPKIDIENHRPI